MKAVKKRAISLILSVILAVVFNMANIVRAEEEFWSAGSISVSYDSESKILKFSGNGDMPELTPDSVSWKDKDINRVIFADGVKSIGKNALYGCAVVGIVYVADSVTFIDDSAFIGNGKLIFLGSYNGYGLTFAKKNGYDFKALGDISADKQINSHDLTAITYDLLVDDYKDLDVSDLNTDGYFNLLDFVKLKYKLLELAVTPEPIMAKAPPTLSTNWDSSAKKVKSNSDNEALELRNAVINAKNTAEIYNITGTKYYVSPDGNDSNNGTSPEKAVKTLSANAISGSNLRAGDAVLFERGGLWRLSSPLACANGVTYGSYGVGEKPTFFGSPYNYASKDFWTPSRKKYVWKATISDNDVGQVVCNHGALVGKKQFGGVVAVESNGDYYFDRSGHTLYFYLDRGNPGNVFGDIEIPTTKDGIDVDRAENVIIDNIRLKYVGKHGVDLCDCNGSKITNCEMGFIGGSVQSGNLRYGNAIQVWNGVDGHLVENCWVYQIYDAALTFQGDNSYEAGFLRNKANNDLYKNITYRNNLVEYSTYSFEFWHSNTDMDGTEHDNLTTARFQNINISDNISRFAGYGWGRQRPDHMGNHIMVWRRALPNSTNNVISNNIFDMADSYMVYWQFKDKDANNNGQWNITNNTYFHGRNLYNECINYQYMSYATGITDLRNCVNRFEKTPKSVTWVN
ncbi:MAG: hypothetical protein MJ090_04950 [Clostridia bacterium]|nr:hypothetical protein [Clostridia bacterium]